MHFAHSPNRAVVADEQETRARLVDGERKTVTALFADIKGSMALIEDLDPEEARAIVDPALALMMDAVHRYDGYVVQSTGDGIFALFGAPLAHEDHPQRALHAGLRMQEEMRRYAERLRAEKGLTLLARVGVNTGEVVVRSLKTGTQTEYTPIGHSTSLAARLQALATPGSVVMSEAVRRLVEGYFQYKSLGLVRITGVSEPVELHEVTGLGLLRTRLQRAVQRGLSKFVGRNAEMQQLRHVLELAQAGHGQIAAAVGEAGVGKSRLFFEFKAIARSRTTIAEAFSVSHGKASTYLPVIELLKDYFDIAPDDDPRRCREKVMGRLLTLERGLEDTLPYLFALLGLTEGEDPLAQMDEQVKRRRTQEALKRLVLRTSLVQPVMLVFEDLHWVDDETQALLNVLADSIANARVLLLVNYRPEYRHDWGNRTYYTQLRLDPLGIESAAEMLTALLGDGTELAALKRLVIEKTQGNPFFMEEMVQALFEEGALERNETVRLIKPLEQIRIPTSVQGVLTARIDRLPAQEKTLLQTLAVIGTVFAERLVREVTGVAEDALHRMLSDLNLAEFIYEQPAVGAIEYTFKHALTHDVTYHSVLSERRKFLHERTGQAIERLCMDRLDECLDELAHHFTRSGNAVKAVEYLHRAGVQAATRSLHQDACRHLRQALSMLATLPESRERHAREIKLQFALGESLLMGRGITHPEIEPVSERLRVLCEAVGDHVQLGVALIMLATYYRNLGQLARAASLAEQVLEIAGKANAGALVWSAHMQLTMVESSRGNFAASLAHQERAVAAYDPARHGTAGKWGPDNVGTDASVLWALGYPTRALQRARQAVAGTLTPWDRCEALFNETCLHCLRRDAASQREAAQQLIALSEAQGFPFWLAAGKLLHAASLATSGAATATVAEISDRIARVSARFNPPELALIAEVQLLAGQHAEALATVQKALAVSARTGVHSADAELHRLKGEALLAQQTEGPRFKVESPHPATDAEECFRQALEIARGQEARSSELRAATSLARLLRTQGKNAEARELLAPIYNWFTEGFDTRDLQDAKALLAELE